MQNCRKASEPVSHFRLWSLKPGARSSVPTVAPTPTAILEDTGRSRCTTVCLARKLEHCTPLLCDLNWLPVPQPIEFKLASLVFCCLRGTACLLYTSDAADE